LALEIWIFRLIYHLISKYFKEKNIEYSFRGYNAKLLREEISRLKALGYHILPQVIGFGHYGTVYKCLHKIRVDGNENLEEMAAKVIDVSQLVKYRFGRLRPQEMANLQNSMNIGINALNALIHRNICQIERTDIIRDENALISKVVLFSKMAEMNLDFYLKHIKANGVGEECARFWFRQLCDAVNYLHNEYDRNQCLTHSNIKPENVLLFKRVQRVTNCHNFQINSLITIP
jgi:serine/threonine protein kinase